MAEVVGLVATVAGLATTALSVSKTLLDLIQTYENSPQAIQDLQKEVSVLGELLEKIHKNVENSSSRSQFCRTVKEGTYTVAFKRCDRDLNRLQTIVVKLHLSGSHNRWSRLRDTLMWFYLEKDIASVKMALEMHKSLLTILLSLSIS